MNKISELLESLENYEDSDFIQIGTYRENQKLKEIQCKIFLSKNPEVVKLAKKERNDRIIIHLIQIHDLKGKASIRQDKVGEFLFFINQFWNNSKIREFNVHSYEGIESRIVNKLDE